MERDFELTPGLEAAASLVETQERYLEVRATLWQMAVLEEGKVASKEFS